MSAFYSILALFACVIVAMSAEKRKEDLIMEAFLGLVSQSSEDVIEKNLFIIRSSGVTSLCVLVDQLDNKKIAHPTFEGMNSVVVDPKTGLPTGDMMQLTLGQVAFNLIQEMVEGSIPWMYRNYSILNHENVKEWILSRKSKSLNDLQVEAAKLAYENALLIEQKDQSEFSKGLVNFFKLRLERVRVCGK